MEALEWQAGIEYEAAFRRGAHGHLAAVDLDALADADEAVTEAVARGDTLTVVAHFDVQLVGRVLEGHIDPARVRA